MSLATDSAPVTETVTANRVAAAELSEGKGTENLYRRGRGGSGTSLQQIELANEMQPLRWNTGDGMTHRENVTNYKCDHKYKCDQVQV